MVNQLSFSRSDNTKLNLESLPVEVLYLIFKRLMPIDLVTLHNTSARLRIAVTGIKLLKDKCKFYFIISFHNKQNQFLLIFLITNLIVIKCQWYFIKFPRELN